MSPAVSSKPAWGALAGLLSSTLLLFPAPSGAGSAVIVRRPGSGAMAQLSDSMAVELRRKGSEPKIVDLSGDMVADAAKIARDTAADATIYAVGVDAAMTAGEAKSGAPIVALAVPNPARLTADATYVSAYPRAQRVFQFVQSRLRARRVGLLYSPVQNREVAQSFSAAAAGSGVTFVEMPIGSHGDLVRVMKEKLGSVDALLIAIDPIVFDRQSLRFVVERASAQKKPTIGFLPDLAKFGITASLFCDPADVARAAAAQTPTRLQRSMTEVDGMTVVVSRKSAELIGLEPESLGAHKIE